MIMIFYFEVLSDKILTMVLLYALKSYVYEKVSKGMHFIHKSKTFSNIFVYTMLSLFYSIYVLLCTYGLYTISLSRLSYRFTGKYLPSSYHVSSLMLGL